MGAVVELTDEGFDNAVKSAPALLVDFWADWCQPCKVMAPTLEEIAQERDGLLVVAKVDVGAQPELVRRYEITGIPHLILFEYGEVAARITGALPKERVLEVVDTVLGGHD